MAAEESWNGSSGARLAMVPSSAAVSERMSRARRAHTAPERALRSALHRQGLRFRVQRPLEFDRRRKADIVFTRARVAVFVDGCFWHSCPEHATFPKANARAWQNKLRRNRERDADTDSRLVAEGWRVIRVWEHEDPVAAAHRVAAAVRARLADQAGAT
jgi:DNA mismatch endonuclease (patch repair protein)